MHAFAQQPQRNIAKLVPAQPVAGELKVPCIVQQAHGGGAEFDHFEEAGVDLVQVADTQVELVAAEAVDDLFRTQ
ncbi:hypothetical protein D9M71_822210 [compost metagenome]